MHPQEKSSLRQPLLVDERVREMIAARAYQKYESRGRVDGHDREDWHEAENEVLAELAAQQGTSKKTHPRRTEAASATKVKATPVKKIGGRQPELSTAKAAGNIVSTKTPAAKTKAGAALPQAPPPTQLKDTKEGTVAPRKKALSSSRRHRKAEDPSAAPQ